jgi:glycerol kinase
MMPRALYVSFLESITRNLLTITVGITAHTERGHIARATLEATCFQTKAILDAMEKDSNHSLSELAVDGGMSNSDLCMQVRRSLLFSVTIWSSQMTQTQADIIGIPVDRPAMRETTALGAAIVAGFAVDLWKDFDELKEINKEDRTVFKPEISKADGSGMFALWEKAVDMSRGWVEASQSGGAR